MSTTKLAVSAFLLNSLLSGCAALTNPVLNGIPVRRLPTELLSGPRRENVQTIPLNLLKQDKPDDYLLAPGDVLGVFIAGIFPLTLQDQPLPTPPVNFPAQVDPLGAGLPASLGYPFRIRKDGTLTLPLIKPVALTGLTVEEANDRVRQAYAERNLLQPGREAVLLNLLQPRQVRVVVIRQEVGGFSAGGRGNIASSNVKQGTGHIVDMRAYENDVLNALVASGGMPGLDAFDGVYIFRDGQANTQLAERLNSLGPEEDPSCLSDLAVETVYIPTRWPPGKPLPFKPEDVLLQTGDVVFLESRTKDFYYTGGLLPAGERQLPRDYDLDVLEAISLIQGTLLNGAFSGNNFSGVLIAPGLGNPSPSALTVIRRTPSGGQVPIMVDLNRALRDPRERIIVQPDDILILQETAGEAMTRYITNVFNFSIRSARTSADGYGLSVP